ncbi:MAG: gluconate 2-dehydrogenase subunit 3 family protein [Gemmatimonadales bacterium]
MIGGSAEGRIDGLSRRDALMLLLAGSTTAAFPWSAEQVDRAARLAQQARAAAAAAGTSFEPRFFTAREWETVRILVDIIIPRDERSGSATEAGVPEFMDWILTEYPGGQNAMRGGLAWLDSECRRRYGKAFSQCGETERTGVLDDVAWPRRARRELSHGVSFFNMFRDMTASGFFSSRLGVEDLRYMGNTFVAEWAGCPPEALRKLGVTYTD